MEGDGIGGGRVWDSVKGVVGRDLRGVVPFSVKFTPASLFQLIGALEMRKVDSLCFQCRHLINFI